MLAWLGVFAGVWTVEMRWCCSPQASGGASQRATWVGTQTPVYVRDSSLFTVFFSVYSAELLAQYMPEAFWEEGLTPPGRGTSIIQTLQAGR